MENRRRVLRRSGTVLVSGVVGGFLANASSSADVSAALMDGVGTPMLRPSIQETKLTMPGRAPAFFYYAAREALLGGERLA